MKFFPSLLMCAAFCLGGTLAFAAGPATSAAPTMSAPAKKGATSATKSAGAANKTASTAAPTSAPAPTPAAAQPSAPMPQTPAPASVTLDDFIKDLAAQLKLSDAEAKEIRGYYVQDAATLKAILNSGTLSPLQQAQNVADLRDARNDKIDALLEDADRRHEFHVIEAKYRVALTELAAEGDLASAPPAGAK